METNHLAAVYDELNMCKSRLSAYDPEFEEESRLKISKNEVKNVDIFILDYNMYNNCKSVFRLIL